jgi:hypothetical protein
VLRGGPTEVLASALWSFVRVCLGIRRLSRDISGDTYLVSYRPDHRTSGSDSTDCVQIYVVPRLFKNEIESTHRSLSFFFLLDTKAARGNKHVYCDDVSHSQSTCTTRLQGPNTPGRLLARDTLVGLRVHLMLQGA